MRDPLGSKDSASNQNVGVWLLSVEILELENRFWMLNTVLAVTFSLSPVPGVTICATKISGKLRIGGPLSDPGATDKFCEIPTI